MGYDTLMSSAKKDDWTVRGANWLWRGKVEAGSSHEEAGTQVFERIFSRKGNEGKAQGLTLLHGDSPLVGLVIRARNDGEAKGAQGEVVLLSSLLAANAGMHRLSQALQTMGG